MEDVNTSLLFYIFLTSNNDFVMKVLLKILILAGVVAVSILSDDYIARGMSVAVCVATVILGYIFGDSTETRETYSVFLLVSGYFLALTFYLLTMLVQVHVDDYGDSTIVYSRFWTHTLAVGKLETKKIPYGYSTEYGFVHGIESDDFKFVYTRNNTCIICSRYARMMELELPFKLTERDFGDGYIQLIIDKRGQVFDFHGNPVDGNYRPIKVDHTIPDPCP